jgi:hypothetical protein
MARLEPASPRRANPDASQLSQLFVVAVGSRDCWWSQCRSWLWQLVVAIDIRSGCLTIRPHTLEMRD